MSRFAEAVRAAVEGGFEAQARAHGAALHSRAVAVRARDPLVTFLADTFTRQLADRQARAEVARREGAEGLARELGASAEIAAKNLQVLRQAVEG